MNQETVVDIAIVFSGINMVACLLIMIICVWRINSRLSKRFKTFRARYVCLMLAAMCLGLQPIFWSSFPGVETMFASLLIFGFLVLGKVNRRR